MKTLLIRFLVLALVSRGLGNEQTIEDLGYREYFQRYDRIVQHFSHTLQTSCSISLSPSLAPGSKGNVGTDWCFSVNIWNKSDKPVRIPQCALHQFYPALVFIHNGERVAFKGPSKSLRDAENKTIELPPDALVSFNLSLPTGLDIDEKLPSGKYEVRWPFHGEAKCQFEITKRGEVKIGKNN